jgi:TPR repeat protein
VKRLLLTTMTALLLGAGAAWADPLDDGVVAHQRGDYANALRIFRSLAAQGNAKAQYNLGSMYREGRGVAQNSAEATKWVRIAAAQGLAAAQSNLSFMYASGQRVTQNYAEAIKWNRLAAAQGYASAQSNLGAMYSDGRGVTLKCTV